MITRTTLILFYLFVNTIFIVAQPGNKAVSAKDFTDNPWTFEPSVAAMEAKYGDFLKKEKFTVKNRFNPSQKDTIIKFFRGKTEIFFYRPYNGEPLFFTANIYDKKISLKGGISTLMPASELYKKIAYPESNSDTLLISLPDGAYKTTMIFKEKKVFQIKIEAAKKNN
jgi:hypothetical protein